MIDFAERGSTATQTVIPAPLDISGEPAGPHKSLEPAPSARKRFKHLRRSFALFAFFAILASAEAAVPRFRHLLWQLPGYLATLFVIAAFDYLRDFHPNRVPAPLEYGSPHLFKLHRIRKALGWTAFSSWVVGAAVLVAANFTDACSCERHPVLFVLWLATTLLSSIGFQGLWMYIKLRTEAPGRPAIPSRSWPTARRPISEYKAFHSDHWGHPSNSGPPHPSRTRLSEPASASALLPVAPSP